MTDKIEAIVKPVKKKEPIKVRESYVPKIKELYPNIQVMDDSFIIEEYRQGDKGTVFYFEDPTDYTEIKKLINSLRIGYPTVIVRLGNRDLDAKLLDFLAQCRYIFTNDEYTIVMAQKGYASPVFHIKQKFKINTLLQIKELVK